MKYTHAKCTFDNIELLVFYATFNKNSVISWWSRHIVFAPFLITSARLLSGDVLLFFLLHHPDCCLVMYYCSAFLFHYYYYSYYITPTVVGWCIAILRFFFTIIITSPRVMYCYSTFLFHYYYYYSFTYFCPLDFSEMPWSNFMKPCRNIICHVKMCCEGLIFSSPDPKGHVSYCHHLASVVRLYILLWNHWANLNQTWPESSLGGSL
jgi:hypothetical protein